MLSTTFPKVSGESIVCLFATVFAIVNLLFLDPQHKRYQTRPTAGKRDIFFCTGEKMVSCRPEHPDNLMLKAICNQGLRQSPRKAEKIFSQFESSFYRRDRLLYCAFHLSAE
jgi:hypothetical protein